MATTNSNNNHKLSTKILDILNDIYAKDSAAMLALISATIPTNTKILQEYDVKIHKGYIEFGLLSILNKIIEEEDKQISFSYLVNPDGVMQPDKFVLKKKKA